MFVKLLHLVDYGTSLPAFIQLMPYHVRNHLNGLAIVQIEIGDEFKNTGLLKITNTYETCVLNRTKMLNHISI